MADYIIRRVQPVYKAVWPTKRPTGPVQSEKSTGRPVKDFRAAFDSLVYKSETERR